MSSNFVNRIKHLRNPSKNILGPLYMSGDLSTYFEEKYLLEQMTLEQAWYMFIALKHPQYDEIFARLSRGN